MTRTGRVIIANYLHCTSVDREYANIYQNRRQLIVTGVSTPIESVARAGAMKDE